MHTVAVVIPTKNRPDKLRRCLESLALALPKSSAESVYVCDSSTSVDTRQRVADVCGAFDRVHLTFHEGKNVAAARNVCARTATQDLIINVDDDVYVEPDALAALVAAYGAGDGPRVVAGSVAWNNVWSQPIVMRPIGYGRSATTGETPSFLIGAFFLYPRVFALTWPWNENIRTSDDRFMGALWRSRKVKLLFESQARAIHDSEHTSYNARDHHDHIYANLYDAVIANPNLTRALSYEFVGFLCGLRRFLKQPAQARSYISAWVSGNLSFLSDWSMLHALTDRPTPLHSTHSELGHRLG